MDEHEQQASGPDRGEGTPAKVNGEEEAAWNQPPVGAIPQDRPTWGASAANTAGTKNRSWKRTVGAVAVAAVVVAGGVVGVNAMASSAESTGTGQRGPGGMGGYGPGGFPGGVMPGSDGGQGRQGAGQFGLGDALHGDFVVSSGSAYETRRMQRGKITAIGGGTVSITSDDGYSSDYAVGSVDVSAFAVGATVIAVGTVSGDASTLTSMVGSDVVSGPGQVGGTDNPGSESGTDPGQGGMGGPPSGIDPQQGGTNGGQQYGQQAPTTSGTTANA